MDIKFKTGFLKEIRDNFKESSEERYDSLFSVVESYESIFDKDLYDFNKQELLIFLKSRNFTNTVSAKSYLSLIEKYQLKALNERVSIATGVSADSITQNDLDECLNKRAMNERYLTLEEYVEVVNKMQNYQDKIIVVLLWNGVKGKQFDELLELKDEDFNYSNRTLKVNSGKENERIIVFTEFEADVIKKAMEETEYLSTSGDRTKKINIFCEYLIKPTGQNKTKLKLHSLRGRLQRNLDLIERKDISATTISTSGLVYKMFREQKKWSHTEITKYFEENNVKMDIGNFSKILNIFKEKYLSEGTFNTI